MLLAEELGADPFRYPFPVSEAIREGDIPGVQLRCRKLLGVGREEAWSWLTEPEKLARWLAAEVRVEPGAGGGWELSGRDEAGESLSERGRTLEQLPPRRWVLAFERLGAGWPNPTRLTLELAARPGGSEVSVLQEGFQNLPLSACLTIWEAYRRRWRRALDRLARACSE